METASGVGYESAGRSACMMRRTHAATGLLIGFSVGAFYQTPFPETLILALISETASLLPDLDIKLKIKHRTLTHSLLALFIIAALGVWINSRLQHSAFWSILCIAFFLGYASHLFLDLLTVQGIELFYPVHRRIRIGRLRTGGTVDGFLCACALLLTLLPLWSLIRPQILRLQ